MYLFVMAIFGNLTYAGSVLAFSTQVQYLMKQAPWLLGSAGAVVLSVHTKRPNHRRGHGAPRMCWWEDALRGCSARSMPRGVPE